MITHEPAAVVFLLTPVAGCARWRHVFVCLVQESCTCGLLLPKCLLLAGNRRLSGLQLDCRTGVRLHWRSFV